MSEKSTLDISMQHIRDENRIKKERIERDLYETQYIKCMQTIKDFYKTKTYCIFVCPIEYRFERDYNVISCVTYIIKKLKERGFQIQYDPPNKKLL